MSRARTSNGARLPMPGPLVRVWAFNLLLTAICAGILLGPLRGARALDPGHELPWLLIALMIGAGQYFAAHINLRGGTIEVGFTEAGQVMGVLFLDSTSLTLAAAVGFAVSGVMRRRPLVKAYYNTAAPTLVGLVVAAVAHLTTAGAAPMSSAFLGFFTLTILVLFPASMGLVGIVLWLYNGRWEWPAFVNFGAVATLIVADAGLLGGVVYHYAPVGLALFALPVLGVVFGQTAYLAAGVRARRSEFLRDIATALLARRDLDETFADVLQRTAELFGCDDVTLLLNHESGQRSFTWNTQRAALLAQPPNGVDIDAVLAAVPTGLVDARSGALPALRPLFAHRDRGVGLVTTVPRHEGGPSIIVAAWQRSSPAAKTDDLVALQTLAAQLGAALDTTDLGRSLSSVAEQRDDFERRAFRDALTGLANRALLNDRLGHAISRHARSGHPLGVLYIDLDGFKPLNDALGHAAGDEALRLVADRLLASVRDADTVARLGGDEFAVMLEEVHDAAEAQTIADRIVHAVAETMVIGGRKCALGASVGIAMACDGVDAAGLLAAADAAMYEAKRAGKGRVAVAGG